MVEFMRAKTVDSADDERPKRFSGRSNFELAHLGSELMSSAFIICLSTRLRVSDPAAFPQHSLRRLEDDIRSYHIR